jgi:ribonuclease P protein component
MFPKKYRLAKAKDVKAAFLQGRTFFSPLLTIKFRKADSRRFTVVVSTKVSKKAVVRNRLKRISRELLRKNFNHLSSGDYVIVLKPKAALDERLTLAALLEILQKNKLLI